MRVRTLHRCPYCVRLTQYDACPDHRKDATMSDPTEGHADRELSDEEFAAQVVDEDPATARFEQ